MKRLAPPISPLEHDVLTVLWNNKPMLVRDVYAAVKGKRKVAHSSVAVILDRLYQKQLVARTSETCRGGTRYWYHPKTDRRAFVQGAVDSAIRSLVERFGTSAIAHFEERFSKQRR